jgi:hypothetical protein
VIDEPDRLHIAYHEAGHITLGWLVGERVLQASIEGGEDREGERLLGFVDVQDLSLDFCKHRWLDRLAGVAAGDVAVRYAVAQGWCMPAPEQSRRSSHDRRALDAELLRRCPTFGLREAARRYVHEYALVLLDSDEGRQALWDVADALIDFGTLAADELNLVLKESALTAARSRKG